MVIRFVCARLVYAAFHGPFGELAQSKRYAPTFAELVQVSSPCEVKEAIRSCPQAATPASTAAAIRRSLLFITSPWSGHCASRPRLGRRDAASAESIVSNHPLIQDP